MQQIEFQRAEFHRPAEGNTSFLQSENTLITIEEVGSVNTGTETNHDINLKKLLMRRKLPPLPPPPPPSAVPDTRKCKLSYFNVMYKI